LDSGLYFLDNISVSFKYVVVWSFYSGFFIMRYSCCLSLNVNKTWARNRILFAFERLLHWFEANSASGVTVYFLGPIAHLFALAITRLQ